MVNILLINTNCSVNKGSAAQVISTVETLNKLLSEPNFAMISGAPELDSKQCERHNIRLISSSEQTFTKIAYLLKLLELSECLIQCMLWSGLQKIGLNVKWLTEEKILLEYVRSDIIIDLSGDTLSDKNCYSIFPLLGILIGILLNKKVVIYSQSIGYFSKITLPLARFCLNQAYLIVARENETINYLRKIGVDNPRTYLAAEIAFLLRPAPPKRVQEIFLQEGINTNEKGVEPLVGMGTSALMYRDSRLGDPYVLLMAKIADYLVEKMNARVVLISHVIVPPKYDPIDDRYLAHKIYQNARNKNRIKIIEGDYSPEELKGLIGKCKLFIGARMHSNIASTSMLVPTVALAWSHKYYGIMRMLGLEEFVCDIETTKFNELVSTIDSAWINKDEIRRKLASRIAEIEKSAFQGARLIQKLLKSVSFDESAPILERATVAKTKK